MKTLYSKTLFQTKGWEREEHFHFFRHFSQPFLSLHTELDITKLQHFAKWQQLPLSLAYLHATTTGARATENMLLRLEGEQVVKYAGLDVSTTVLKDDKTISFVHLPYHQDLYTFCQNASEIIAQVKRGGKLFHGYYGPDLIHATILPWFTFSGVEHAVEDNSEDAAPKLTFGKLTWKNGRAILPVCVRVHHALADAYHIYLFLENVRASIAAIGNYKQDNVQKPVKTSTLQINVQHFLYRLKNTVTASFR